MGVYYVCEPKEEKAEDKVFCNVYETTDYGKFKKLKGNRELTSKSTILSSIKKHGLCYCPIIVNEKFEVIDGQNRLAACEELGIPVIYILQPGADSETCRALNYGQKNWSSKDFIHFFAENGNESYQRLELLIAEFGKEFSFVGVLPFATARYGGAYGDSGSPQADIKKGALSFSEEQYTLARTRMTSAAKLGFTRLQKERRVNTRPYYIAVSYCYRNQNITVKSLIEKLLENPLMIGKYSSPVEYLRAFDTIYNKGKRPKDKVSLESDFQKKLYLKE